LNENGNLDGGDPYLIYANVSGLRKIDTTNMIRVFKASDYDNLVLGQNQWTLWPSFLNTTNYITDSVGNENLVVNIKYFIQGDVDRTFSSRVWDDNGNLVARAIYKGKLDINVPNTYSVGNPSLYVPFNINTNGDNNYGLQFEMKYDKTKVRFDEIVSNFDGGPWLQYVTHDELSGTIRFGGMNNQLRSGLIGQSTPFKLKFSPIGGEDLVTNIQIRELMDASDENGDHLNIELENQIAVLSYRSIPQNPQIVEEITASIRPNPTTGWFELEVKFPDPNTTMAVAIYDVSGKMIKQFGNISGNGYQTVVYKQIDMTNVSNGNYYLVLNNYNKQLTKQFLKV